MSPYLSCKLWTACASHASISCLVLQAFLHINTILLVGHAAHIGIGISRGSRQFEGATYLLKEARAQWSLLRIPWEAQPSTQNRTRRKLGAARRRRARLRHAAASLRCGFNIFGLRRTYFSPTVLSSWYIHVLVWDTC